MTAGRPPLIDDERLVEAVLFMVENRKDDETACGLCGLGYTTFKYWKRQGREDREAGLDTKFATFMTNYEKAYYKATEEAVEQIRVAGESSWQASAWWLERRRRKQYNPDYSKFVLTGNTPQEKIDCVISGMNSGDIARDYGLRLIAVYQKELELAKVDDMGRKLDELEKRLA